MIYLGAVDPLTQYHDLQTNAPAEISESPLSNHAAQQLLDARWSDVRAKRARLMAEFEWRMARHARELRLGLPPTDNLQALDAYMQALADITLQPDPCAIVWPNPPDEN